jgi:GNAT superfamily N-acetyltransferase
MTRLPPRASVSLRRATPADNRLLAEIGAETFSDSFSADNTPENMAAYLAQAFSPEKQARELADPSSRFLIAEISGEVVGYTRLYFGPAPAAVVGAPPMEIARFYARKHFIGQGVGARLMQAGLDEAAAEKCAVVWLATWERNPRGLAFYRRWGFVPVGTATFQLGDDLQHDLILARPVHLEGAAPAR